MKSGHFKAAWGVRGRGPRNICRGHMLPCGQPYLRRVTSELSPGCHEGLRSWLHPLPSPEFSCSIKQDSAGTNTGIFLILALFGVPKAEQMSCAYRLISLPVDSQISASGDGLGRIFFSTTPSHLRVLRLLSSPVRSHLPLGRTGSEPGSSSGNQVGLHWGREPPSSLKRRTFSSHSCAVSGRGACLWAFW